MSAMPRCTCTEFCHAPGERCEEPGILRVVKGVEGYVTLCTDCKDAWESQSEETSDDEGEEDDDV